MAVVFSLKEIRVIELDAALARGPEDGSVVLRGDESPNLPVRDGRGEAVAKGARQGRDAAKLADNPVHGLHDPRFYTLGVNRQHGMCKASSLHVLWMKPAEELRKLIERSGVSQEKVAQAAGYAFASGLQRYISDDYAKPFLPRELVEKLKKPLVGKGTPPITEDEIYALAGLLQRTVEIPGAPMVEVAALSVEGAMGGGAVVESEEEIGRFGFPAGEFSVSPERLRIITVIGDSMFNPSDPSSLQSGG